MRGKLISFFIVSILISSLLITGCKKDEETVNGQTITMNAKLDGHDWETSEVYASYNSGYLNIVGTNPLLGTIMITVDEFDEGTYEFGASIHRFATFSTKDQITYYTNPYGSGEISITTINTDYKYVSGTFSFTAKDLSGNTITATEGVFTSQYD